ncbi:MAG: tRNA (N(6)-L-threonylcarbamoyladenosine(37)-C(2))-methylthiotransferase [Candidatus Helarchaeota archaeon]|nr:tRNA (N(6)-L-threonylcarbamoyladenosine(37)-C(2))-methylthiotransferase [Candidatus Helarchaeota archaeon]
MNCKIYMETFGCSFNQASSEIMQGIFLSDKNYQLVPSVEDSTIIILNSCIVKTNTEARITNKIKKYTKNYPNKGLLITGCMSEVFSEQLLQINPKISMLGPHFITDVLKAIQSITQGKQYIQIGKRKESKLCLPRRIQNPIIAKLQIAQGCLNNCSYCITKHAMGNLYSYSMEHILEEIKIDLNKGCKEIWLSAQDTGCYGFDLNTSLPELLEKIIQISSDFRIRVGMMNPKSLMDIYEPLIQIYSRPKIYKFIHVPIQSGNDEILKKMNRQYAISEIQNLLVKFRRHIPDLSLSIDVIVGFPSETNDQFEDTVSFVKQIHPDIVNISKFGARLGTPAARLKPLPTKIVKERSTIISQICNQIARTQNLTYIQKNSEQRVLTTSLGKKGGIIARTNNYKPVILKENCELGKFYDVKLLNASRNHLNGILVTSPHQLGEELQ